jgi:hypothetical protein
MQWEWVRSMSQPDRQWEECTPCGGSGCGLCASPAPSHHVARPWLLVAEVNLRRLASADDAHDGDGRRLEDVDEPAMLGSQTMMGEQGW